MEWRRIYKALYAIDYIIKNGAPRFTNDIRADMFKITTLQNFTFYEENKDKGQGVRDKACAI